jgi:hypothetical protein
MNERPKKIDEDPIEYKDILNPTNSLSKEDFHMIKVIARGSTFGKVFLVKMKQNNQVYAMKVQKKQ